MSSSRGVRLHRIPVVVAGLRGILADIVTELLSAQNDIQVLERDEPDQALAAVREEGARVVILELLDGDLPQVGRQLLSRYPSLSVLGIAGHGRTASLYELRPVCTPLGELSAESLAAAVRSAACT